MIPPGSSRTKPKADAWKTQKRFTSGCYGSIRQSRCHGLFDVPLVQTCIQPTPAATCRRTARSTRTTKRQIRAIHIQFARNMAPGLGFDISSCYVLIIESIGKAWNLSWKVHIPLLGDGLEGLKHKRSVRLPAGTRYGQDGGRGAATARSRSCSSRRPERTGRVGGAIRPSVELSACPSSLASLTKAVLKVGSTRVLKTAVLDMPDATLTLTDSTNSCKPIYTDSGSTAFQTRTCPLSPCPNGY